MNVKANSRNAFLLVACALSWLLCACTTSAAVESLCDNGVDEDGDNLIDCHDPDCQASNDCLGARAAEITTPDAATRKPPLYDAGNHPKPEVGDAWAGTPDATASDAAPEDSGGPLPPAVDEDAGPPDPCTLCAVDEACVDTKCQPAASATSGAYFLRILSGSVPLSDAITLCYDACLISPFAVCTCPPDPYVRVLLRHDSQETLIGQTPIVQDALMPVFPDNQFEIDIARGDVLRFEVYDFDDLPDQPDLLYTCRVDLRDVSTDAPTDKPIECVGLAGLANGMPFRILAQLTPRPSP
jgi:hypothetical protein